MIQPKQSRDRKEGKVLKNCRTCRDKKNKRNTPSETQETERSQPPCSSEEEYDEQPRRIPPTYEHNNDNHYSNKPLCKADYLMPSPEKPKQSIKRLLTDIHDNLTNKSSNTVANEMLNDIANRLTIIENDNFLKEFIEYQRKQNEETTRLLNLIQDVLG